MAHVFFRTSYISKEIAMFELFSGSSHLTQAARPLATYKDVKGFRKLYPPTGLAGRTSKPGRARLSELHAWIFCVKFSTLAVEINFVGKPRQNYDVMIRGSLNDLNGLEGLLVATRDVLRVVRRGLFWSGIPCSSQLVVIYVDSARYIYLARQANCNILNPRWVWLASSSTGRLEDIAGKNSKCVLDANKLVARWALLCCVALARGVHWLASWWPDYVEASGTLKAKRIVII